MEGMYNGTTSVRAIVRNTSAFPITVDLHYSSRLSLLSIRLSPE